MDEEDKVLKCLQDSESEFQAGNTKSAAIKFRQAIVYARAMVAKQRPKIPLNVAEAIRFQREFFERWPLLSDAKQSSNVLIVSDSIGLPRPSIGLEVEDVYASRIAQWGVGGDFQVIPFCQRNRTSQDALKWLHSELTWKKKSRILILQVGIVDCAPRVFAENDVYDILASSGNSARAIALKLVSSYRKHLEMKPPFNTYVHIDAYRENVKEMILYAKHVCKVENIILVDTVTPSRQGKKMAGAPLSRNVGIYNEVLHSMNVYEFVHVVGADAAIWNSDDPCSCFQSDNYHYNKKGHEIVGDKIIEAIQNIVE